MTRRIRLVTREVALAAHARSLKDHGGAAGVRDEGLLASALARPQNLAAYRDPTLFELAAALGYGLVKNHPFIDGNKRTAFLCAYVFLGLNGLALEADEAEAAAIMLDLAAGKVSEAEFARWLELSAIPVARQASKGSRRRNAGQKRAKAKPRRKAPARKSR